MVDLDTDESDSSADLTPESATTQDEAYLDLGDDPAGTVADEARRFGLRITSGQRSVSHNAAIGGAPDSYHLRGQAYDLAGPPPKMRGFTNYMNAVYGPNLRELFHDPVGGWKSGQAVGAIGGHSNHVHVAWDAPGANDDSEGPQSGESIEGMKQGAAEILREYGIHLDQWSDDSAEPSGSDSAEQMKQDATRMLKDDYGIDLAAAGSPQQPPQLASQAQPQQPARPIQTRQPAAAQQPQGPVYSWTDPYTKSLAGRFEEVKRSGTPTARTDAQEIARELQRRGYRVWGLGQDEWPAIEEVPSPRALPGGGENGAAQGPIGPGTTVNMAGQRTAAEVYGPVSPHPVNFGVIKSPLAGATSFTQSTAEQEAALADWRRFEQEKRRGDLDAANRTAERLRGWGFTIYQGAGGWPGAVPMGWTMQQAGEFLEALDRYGNDPFVLQRHLFRTPDEAALIRASDRAARAAEQERMRKQAHPDLPPVATLPRDIYAAMAEGAVRGTGGLLQTAANIARLSGFEPVSQALAQLGLDPHDYVARLLERGAAGATELANTIRMAHGDREGFGYDLARNVGAALPSLLPFMKATQLGSMAVQSLLPQLTRFAPVLGSMLGAGTYSAVEHAHEGWQEAAKQGFISAAAMPLAEATHGLPLYLRAPAAGVVMAAPAAAEQFIRTGSADPYQTGLNIASGTLMSAAGGGRAVPDRLAEVDRELETVDPHSERAGRLLATRQSLARQRGAAPESAVGPQGSGPEPLRTEALDPDSMLGQARALHTARLQERASKISDELRYLRDVEGAGPDDPDVEELEHERLGIAREGEWLHGILNKLEYNPEWEKLPLVTKQVILGLEDNDDAQGQKSTARAGGVANREAPELPNVRNSDRGMIPEEDVFDYETRPDAGDDAKHLAREAISDLKQIGAARSARALIGGVHAPGLQSSESRVGEQVSPEVTGTSRGGEIDRAFSDSKGNEPDRRGGAIPPGSVPDAGLQQAGSGVQRLGLGITEPLAREGRIDLRGQQITGPDDVAKLAQVYRDPRFETFRIVYTKGDRVVGHTAVTSRLPGHVAPFVTDAEGNVDYARAVYEIKNRIERLGADGYYLLHNHPSGRPGASPADLALTRYVEGKIPGFKGHVIINSGEYGFISPSDGAGFSTRATNRAQVFGLPGPAGQPDPLLTPSLPHELLGRTFENARDLASATKRFHQVGNVTLLYLSADSSVRAIDQSPIGLFLKPEEFGHFIRGQQRKVGGERVIAYTDDPLLWSAGKRYVKNNTLFDYVEGSGISARRGAPASQITRRPRGFHVEEQ